MCRVPAVALLLAAALGGCRRAAPARETVLREVVTRTVLPSYRELSAAARRLTAAGRALADAPTVERLRAAQEAVGGSIEAIKRTYAFRSGPIDELKLHFRAGYFPIRASAIDALVGGDIPIDRKLMESSGVSVKGLFAIEYLLFDPAAGDAAVLERMRGAPRRGQYLRALVEDVERQAGALEEGSRELAATFAAGGQQSLGRLVNEMTEAVESAVAGKMVLAATLSSKGALGRGLIEGERSGVSHRIAAALVDGAARIYAGGEGGLGALVRPLAPRVDEKLRGAFAASTRALAALPGPLETVVARDPAAIEKARAAGHALELALKTELMSVLGVTPTFRSMDGD